MEYPHPYLAVCLLDNCNKACDHCYRTAIGSERGFMLSEQDASSAIDDADALGTACMFAGGEPTIWKADGMDCISLLIKAAKRHGRTALLSNGYVFEDKDFAYRFVRQYTDECSRPLQMVFSVDFFHGNYDEAKERVLLLDNLIAACDACSANEVISFMVLSHWTNDKNQNVPLRVFERYAEKGIRYRIEDFMTWGRAGDAASQACFLEVGSRDKEPLGPYQKILTARLIAAGDVNNQSQFMQLPNREVLKMASVCGRSPNFFISWGKRYYYCIPHMGHDWFGISEIGRLSLEAMESFYAARPVIREIQDLSIFGVLDKYQGLVPVGLLEQINAMRESIRFACCSACLRLHEEGVLEKINREMLTK